MRLFACGACKRAVYVVAKVGDESNRLLSETSYPCVTPLCRGRMLSTHPAKLPAEYPITDVPIQNFYRAVHGLGLSGAPASLRRLQELLLSQRVVDLVVEPVGQPERVIVRELVLENGARLHFETSAKGACVYYIEEPENEPPTDVAIEGGYPNREEAGRVAQTESGGSQVSEGTHGDTRTSELPDSERVSAMPEAGGVHPNDFQGPPDPDSGSGMRM